MRRCITVLCGYACYDVQWSQAKEKSARQEYASSETDMNEAAKQATEASEEDAQLQEETKEAEAKVVEKQKIADSADEQ